MRRASKRRKLLAILCKPCLPMLRANVWHFFNETLSCRFSLFKIVSASR
jgi:hypothetical protein